MIGPAYSGDPERVIRDIEQQVQQYPLRAARLTGSRNRLLGLFLLSRDVPLAGAALQDVLAEFAVHLEKTAAAGSGDEEAFASRLMARGPERPPLAQVLAAEIERTRQTRRPCALILLHLEGLPRGGTRAAQEQLRHEVFALVRTMVRRSDILLPCDAADLAVVLPSISLREAIDCAERIREAIYRQLPGADATAPMLTASIGIGLCKATDRLSADGFAARVTRELERARHEGGNRICRVESVTDLTCQVTVEERTELFAAFKRDQQP